VRAMMYEVSEAKRLQQGWQMLATTAKKNLEDLRKTLPAPPQGTSSHEPAPASSPVRAVHEKPQQAMYDQGDWAATAAPETAADGKDSTESSFKPAAAAPVIDIRSAPSRREADSDPPHKQGDVDRESQILVVSATPTTPTHYDASSPSNKLPNAAITDRVPTGPAMVPPPPRTFTLNDHAAAANLKCNHDWSQWHMQRQYTYRPC